LQGFASAGPEAGTQTRAHPPDQVYAALDLGTNNCRLLVVRPRGGPGFRVIDAFSRIVRLGEGMATADCLAEAAMDRTI
jgi:exopolyphosphatase/guanosine-5'-triphosphate,3'-diphosphate pyrophosphatase